MMKMLGILFYVFLSLLSLEAKERILSTSPAITDIVTSLGAADELVAVSDYCKLPDGLSLPRIGSALRLNLEMVVKMAPSLVILNSSADTKILSDLKKLQFKLITTKHDRLDDILESTSVVARAIGKEEKGAALVQRLSQIRHEFKPLEKKRVLAVIGTDIEMGKLKSVMAASHETYFADMLADFGQKYVLSSSRGYISIDLERLSKLDVDILFEFKDKKAERSLEDLIKENPLFHKVRVVTIYGDEAMVPGPGLFSLYKKIYEELKNNVAP
jgi:iron complex transport system substrate-binding protein